MKTEGNQCPEERHGPGDCPIAKVSEILGDACSMLIVRDLLSGPKRFSEISASLKGISTRTVSIKLKSLEAAALVLRESFSERPPRVQYSLTEKGQGLESIIASMKKYAEKHL